MNVNISLLGQMITFALFVFVTMKYVWPPIMQALEERRDKIADGLEKAERGRRELELAQQKISGDLKAAREKAAHIEDEARHKASQIVEKSKDDARVEGEKMIKMAKDQIDQEYNSVRQKLVKELSTHALKGMEKLLGQGVDEKVNARLIDEMIEQISEA